VNDEVTLLTRFGFFLGVGTMGVIAGLGLGSKQPNKLALLVGVGSLGYANHLNEVVKLEAGVAKGFERSYQQARAKLPSIPFKASLPQARFTFG